MLSTLGIRKSPTFLSWLISAMGPVGYIGPRNLVLEQLQLLVMQLAVFHSYHDVQVITIMPEEERDQWDWLRCYRMRLYKS